MTIKIYWLAPGSWSMAAGRFFFRERVYRRGKWTPIVRVSYRRFQRFISEPPRDPQEVGA